MGKTIAETLSCVEAKAPVKTEIFTFVPLRAYTVVDTRNEVEIEVLVYAQADMFAQLQAKSVTDTLTPY